MDWITTLVPAVSPDPMEVLADPPEMASLVELRLDLFPDLDPAAAVATCPLPIVATLRSTAEGGQGPTDPAERARRLQAAIEAGVALVDLEADRDRALIDRFGLEPERVVLSWHDPLGTPDDLQARCDAMLSQRARWVKIVPTARSLDDLERVLSLHLPFRHQRAGRRRLIAFAMGLEGVASRYLAPLLGAPLMFAAWSEGLAAAPGQLTATAMDAVMGHLEAPPQRVFGVIGADVSRSLSPRMHGAAYRELSLPFVLLPMSVPDPDQLSRLLAPTGETLFDRAGLTAGGWAITTPHKAAALAAATIAAPRARRANAANTIILKPNRILAENTDADGVVGSLTGLGLDPAGRSAAVQGTGGAARGAAVGLFLAGAETHLRGRDPIRTRAVAEAIGVEWLASEASVPDGSILVNATPLGGRAEDPSPFSAADVEAAHAVVEMVYSDRPTPLEELAAASHIPTASGRDVLAYQGFAQFAAFTGTAPPRETMRRALD